MAEANSRVQYFHYESELVESRIKLQMGFTNANITLQALDVEEFPNRYWNERIVINNADGDFGVLRNSAVPEPILEVASHFTSLSSRVSLQRTKKFVLFFRMALSFQILSIILWAVACCIISKTIAIGGQFLLLSGLAQIVCNIFVAIVPSLIIHLPGARLVTQFGWCWSLNLGMGLFSIIIAVIVQFMECFAKETIQEFMNYSPFEDDDCFECTQIGTTCPKCELTKMASPTPKYKYESETSKAVRQIVNGGKLYPKAITMAYDNEIKYDRQRNSKKAKKTPSPKNISESIPVDQTLSFGDWKIMEPGNFGTQPHFLEGYITPTLLPTLQRGSIDNEFYRTMSTLSDSTISSQESQDPDV